MGWIDHLPRSHVEGGAGVSSGDSTRLMEGLRRKYAESRSLVSGKARNTLVGLDVRVREIRGNRHRSGMTNGFLQWGLRWCGFSDPVDLGEDCGCLTR